MSQPAVNQPQPNEVEADRGGPPLRLVDPTVPEQPDHQQQRRAFQARCGEVARHLSRIERFEDRIAFYRMGVVSRLELTTAAALYPELMPTLNGEWEWIAVTMADLD